MKNIFKENIISSITNDNGITRITTTSTRVSGIFIGVIVISLLIFLSIIYSFTKPTNAYDICQDIYNKEFNRVYDENIQITNSCTDTADSSGGLLLVCLNNRLLPTPINTCVKEEETKEKTKKNNPNRFAGIDEKNIVISDWLNSQEIEQISGYQNIICKRSPTSPLCTEEWALERLYILTEMRLPGKNWFPILLGITNAESSFGTNFANDNIGGKCNGRNNLGGIKWKITDDNKKVFNNNGKFGYNYSRETPTDDYGCYLYPFDSLEDYWISKVNTFRFGYKGCIDDRTPITCVSYAYVGDRYVSEKSWVNNVSILIN